MKVVWIALVFLFMLGCKNDSFTEKNLPTLDLPGNCMEGIKSSFSKTEIDLALTINSEGFSNEFTEQSKLQQIDSLVVNGNPHLDSVDLCDELISDSLTAWLTIYQFFETFLAIHAAFAGKS